MPNRLVYVPERVPALNYAAEEMERRGICFASGCCDEVSHVLLPVPCKWTGEKMREALKNLPKTVKIFGGGLKRPELDEYYCRDLLTDAGYLAKNAMITAYCALRLAQDQLPVVWEGCPVLILGWGRIGKCLGSLMKRLGTEVSVAARKPEDLAMIAALGCDGRNISTLDCVLKRYRVIFNTVPAPVLSRGQVQLCREDCVLVELASKPGVEAANVIDGRSLPGRLAPESSGKLIARTVMGLWAREEEHG